MGSIETDLVLRPAHGAPRGEIDFCRGLCDDRAMGRENSRELVVVLSPRVVEPSLLNSDKVSRLT